jgi:RNA polymerase sigma factor (sigma-70 family)
MDAEELFLAHIGTIERIAAFVCRRNGLHDDDAAEFAAETKLRLLENDYAVIRKFEGRSSLPTYLRTVIARFLYERRVEEWGKWRPSAEARRLGARAILLEQYVTRDGYSFEEAVQILTAYRGGGHSRAELEAIWARLPSRMPRPMLVPEEASEGSAASATADAPLLSRERERTARTAAATIDRVIDAMLPDDQLILRMRFWEARKVPEIAELLNIEQKRLYKRLERLMVLLKRALEDAGIRHGDVREILSCGDTELEIHAVRKRSGENRLMRLSMKAESSVEDGDSPMNP